MKENWLRGFGLAAAFSAFVEWVQFGQVMRRRAALLRARQERAAALRAYAEAKLRGDTRSVHQTYRRYREATHATVRAELAL